MKQNNVEYIRQLLDRYYQGDSTAGEEQTLKDYFSGEVDDALAGEAEMFRTLTALEPSVPEVPGDLEAQLLEIIGAAPDNTAPEGENGYDAVAIEPAAAPPRRHGLLRVLYPAIGIAAALLIGLLVIKGISGPTATPAGTFSLDVAGKIAKTEIPDTFQAKTIEVDSDLTAQAAPAPEARKMTGTAVPQQVATVAAQTAPADAQQASREVTDPDEAARIVEQVAALLSSGLSNGNQAVLMAGTRVESSVCQYNRIVNN